MNKLITIFLIFILIFILPISFDITNGSNSKTFDVENNKKNTSDVENNKKNITSQITISNNPVLTINGNNKLKSYATSGNGSSINPYIIENYIIMNNTSTLVEISNTNDQFILRNFTLNFTGSQDSANTMGIYLNNVTYATIENSIISNSYFAIVNQASYSLIFQNITITNVFFGFDFKNSNFCSILNNTIKNSYQGINLYKSQNDKIDQNRIQIGLLNTDFNISFVLAGININESNYNSIGNNFMEINYQGINLINSNSTKIYSNSIISSSSQNPHGISLVNSINSTITNNSLIAGGIVIDGLSLDGMKQNSVTNNTVNNLPILFLENKQNVLISEKNGQIILLNCSFITISNQIINNTYHGIQLLFSKNNIIKNNTIFNTPYSFYLLYSNTNLLLNDSALNSTNIGFYIRHSDYNSLINSTAFRTLGTFLFYSNYNTINNCNSTKNGYGLYLFSSTNQKIVKSAFSQNYYVGLEIVRSNNTIIMSNNVDSNNGDGLEGYLFKNNSFIL